MMRTWGGALPRLPLFCGAMLKGEFKRPESVLVVVFTAAGDVLLLRRLRPAGFWQSITGSLKWGEQPRQAAVRELFEETGLSGSGLIDLHHSVSFPIVPPWKARYAPSAHINREHWYALRLPSRRLVRRSPGEHGEHRWLPLWLAARRATSWTNREAILRVSRMLVAG